MKSPTSPPLLALELLEHDASVSALSPTGDLLCVIEEERLSRVRHAPGAGLPLRSIRYVSGALGLRDPAFCWLPETHHFLHAVSACGLSGFREAAVLVADAAGSGEILSGEPFVECTSFYHARDNEIRLLKKQYLPHSLGEFYSLFTGALGFGFLQEGKFMGLAGHGNPSSSPYRTLRRAVELAPGGEVHLSPDYFQLELGAQWYRRNKARAQPHLDTLPLYGFRIMNPGEQRAHFQVGLALQRKILKELGLPSHPLSPPFGRQHRDLAAAVQRRLEEALLHMARWLRQETGCDSLCMAGGVALNCVANELLLRKAGFQRGFFQPSAGDGGLSLGRAVNAFRRRAGRWPGPQRHAFCGRSYPEEYISSLLENYARNRLTLVYFPPFLGEGEVQCLWQGAGAEGQAREGTTTLKPHDATGAYLGELDFTGLRRLGLRYLIRNAAHPLPWHFHPGAASQEEFRQQYDLALDPPHAGRAEVDGEAWRLTLLPGSRSATLTRSTSARQLHLQACEARVRLEGAPVEWQVGLFGSDGQVRLSPRMRIDAREDVQTLRVDAERELEGAKGGRAWQDNFQFRIFRAGQSDRETNMRLEQVTLWEAPGRETEGVDDRRGQGWEWELGAIEWKRCESIAEEAAGAVAGGGVVAWFQGAGELGPRALGHRSLLGDPRDPGLQDRLNREIKFREDFRPYAPSVTVERAREYFDLEGESPYMLRNANVRRRFRSRLPAITHADGTARLQTVDRDTDPLFHECLQAFERLTGYPILLNTSLNIKGEPIVETPQDALQTFLRVPIDALALGPFWVTKALAKATP